MNLFRSKEHIERWLDGRPPGGTIPVTKLIDDGTVTGGDIFTTEPALAGGKYVALIDNKHIYGFQNVAPIVSKK